MCRRQNRYLRTCLLHGRHDRNAYAYVRRHTSGAPPRQEPAKVLTGQRMQPDCEGKPRSRRPARLRLRPTRCRRAANGLRPLLLCGTKPRRPRLRGLIGKVPSTHGYRVTASPCATAAPTGASPARRSPPSPTTGPRPSSAASSGASTGTSNGCGTAAEWPHGKPCSNVEVGSAQERQRGSPQTDEAPASGERTPAAAPLRHEAASTGASSARCSPQSPTTGPHPSSTASSGASTGTSTASGRAGKRPLEELGSDVRMGRAQERWCTVSELR